MTLHLRPYQKEAIEAVKAEWSAGRTDVLIVMATGAGKTITFLELLDGCLTEGKRGLIIAHRQELIQQPLDRIGQYWQHRWLKTGVVMADKNECSRQLIIGTVQTLGQERRMKEVLAHGPIDYLVIDECHHGNAKTYVDLVKRLREANPELRHLGVTATPIRSDGDGLKKLYSKVAYKAGIKELVKLGHLVPFKALAVQTNIRLDDIASSGDDFVQSQLANVWEMDNNLDLVVESHQKYAGDRPTMAFVVSVEGAHRLADKFNAAGIPAAWACGTTDRDERKRIVEAFKRGETQVLCNCALWTEGLDLPKIACVHMARPTKSDLVYVQAMGRGLRTHPGKEDCLILDYAPEDVRNIVMAGDILGKPKAQRKVEQKAQKSGVIVEGFSFTGEGTGVDGDPDELVTRPLNYLSTSPHAWFYSNNLSTLGMGQAGTLAILPPAPGQNGVDGYRLMVIRQEGNRWSKVECLAASADFDELAERGAEYAEENGEAILVADQNK